MTHNDDALGRGFLRQRGALDEGALPAHEVHRPLHQQGLRVRVSERVWVRESVGGCV